MAENLAYLPEVTLSSERSSDIKRYYVYDYEGSDVKAAKNTENSQKYGALYNWPVALNIGSANAPDPDKLKSVCPAGWHIPANSEWIQLEKYLGMNESDLATAPGTIRRSEEVGKEIKSSVGWEDDEISFGSIGFNALPGGMLGGQSGKFVLINRFANFWTSPSPDNMIYPFGLSVTHSATFYNSYPKGIYAMSVRCIKDK